MDKGCVLGLSMSRNGMADDDDTHKRALIRGFCYLDRRGLIEHDWSEVHETGLAKVTIKADEIETEGTA